MEQQPPPQQQPQGEMSPELQPFMSESGDEIHPDYARWLLDNKEELVDWFNSITSRTYKYDNKKEDYIIHHDNKSASITDDGALELLGFMRSLLNKAIAMTNRHNKVVERGLTQIHEDLIEWLADHAYEYEIKDLNLLEDASFNLIEAHAFRGSDGFEAKRQRQSYKHVIAQRTLTPIPRSVQRQQQNLF